MKANMSSFANPKITVVGLGYVGLPLATALASKFPTIGLDIDAQRIAELKEGYDRTNELSGDELFKSRLTYTNSTEAASGSNLYIVTVPTPVDASNTPDLRPLLSATRSVAGMLQAGRPSIVVYESTVYPGVTEDVCGPLLEEVSGLRRGSDFWLAYSPERINPGDREHTVDKIVKVVAGENPIITSQLAHVYGQVTKAGVFSAANIKTAEAAKVIENAQRDINIAFMNEVSIIFSKIGLSMWDVLEAAGTKWNFLKFRPGLVGGHCIGVDPYYLSHLAQRLGHEPEIVLAGRKVNDQMGEWIAGEIARCAPSGSKHALVLGVTFKENVPDIRNSKVVDMIKALEERGFTVSVHDPLADPAEVSSEYGISLVAETPRRYDCVVGAVAHDQYRSLSGNCLQGMLRKEGLLADLKGMWRDLELPGVRRWSL